MKRRPGLLAVYALVRVVAFRLRTTPGKRRRHGCAAFMSPARARPVPFCLYSLRPEPVTSLLPFVEAVKRRRASSSATTARV
jgi:hypothetical protein